MTLVVTGRSVLGALYANGGEATLDALPAKLGADENAILRMVQSLSAARLVAAPGPTPHRITLTEAGRKWCAAELAPAPLEETKPIVQAPPPPAASGRMSLFPESRAAKEVRPRPQERHHDRMKGVDVVRVKPRNPGNPRLPTVNGQDASPEPERRAAPAPATKEDAPPVPPMAPASVAVDAPTSVTPVKETQAVATAKEETVSTPETAAQPKQTRKRKPAAKVAAEQDADASPISIDRDGFVTHINGKKIF